MPDVQTPAGIREHLQHVVLGAGRIRIGLVKLPVAAPALLPLQLDFVMVVRAFRHRDFRVFRFLRSPPCSIGVSKMNALSRSPGWARMRRNPLRPIYPAPMFSCRSTCDPRGVLESLA